jgi:hypothetical protein
MPVHAPTQEIKGIKTSYTVFEAFAISLLLLSIMQLRNRFDSIEAAREAILSSNRARLARESARAWRL